MKINKCILIENPLSSAPLSPEFLSSYLDGECSQDEKILLEGHLAQCPACFQEVEDLRFFSQSLQELKKQELAVPFDFSQKIMATIEKSELSQEARLLTDQDESFAPAQEESALGKFFSKLSRQPVFPLALAAMLMLAVYLPNPSSLPDTLPQQEGLMMTQGSQPKVDAGSDSAMDQDVQPFMARMMEPEVLSYEEDLLGEKIEELAGSYFINDKGQLIVDLPEENIDFLQDFLLEYQIYSQIIIRLK